MAEIKSRRIVMAEIRIVMANILGQVVFVMAIIHFVMAERLRDQILAKRSSQRLGRELRQLRPGARLTLRGASIH